jgi:hypothetical protein
MAKNTTATINAGVKVTDGQILNEVREAAKVFADEKLVKASIPKGHAKFIGETLPLRINGVGIVLPVDGKQYSIPESFANHLQEYLNNLTI